MKKFPEKLVNDLPEEFEKEIQEKLPNSNLI